MALSPALSQAAPAATDPARSKPQQAGRVAEVPTLRVAQTAVANPEQLHPALWRADALGRAAYASSSNQASALACGFADLDRQLPGGGWPAQALTELLLPHAGVGELRLLAPVLSALQSRQRCVVWFDPPATPCAWALGALGIQACDLVVVRSKTALKGSARKLLPAADILWALEQTLKSGHAGAVVAWLPTRLPADALRRLQLAAQAHDGPAFVLRDAQERARPSPAPLRLLLASAGPDRLLVHLLKRRGPPLLQPLTLTLPPVLPNFEADPHAIAFSTPLSENQLKEANR